MIDGGTEHRNDYPLEFDQCYEVMNETQRELDFIKNNLSKNQKITYLNQLNTDRRSHLKK